MAHDTLREWLAREPYTLVMSSGFFGFFAHAGLLSALESEGLLPSRAAGSSAGALVTGCWAAGVDAGELREVLFALGREDFWDPALGPGLLRGERFARLLEDLLPASDFARCRAPLSVSVFDLMSRRTRVLDSGPLVPAIRASCTFPLLLQPTWHRGRPLMDGGIADRAGLAGVVPGRRALHHHLSSRSPWRSRDSTALRAPERAGLVALVLQDLPRLGPFRLERGREAYARAREAGLRALDEPAAPLVAVRARSS